MTAIDIEHTSTTKEASLARDESRLSMIAYWLERYRNAEFVPKSDVAKKFEQLKANLETRDAVVVADAWFANGPIPTDNRFREVAVQIRDWASSASGRD